MTGSLLNRSIVLTSNPTGPNVLYWMTRDQRVQDHWGLLRCQEIAKQTGGSIQVVVAMRPDLTQHHGTARWLDFMLAGLKEVEQKLSKLGIPFTFLIGDSVSLITSFIHQNEVGWVITDQFPLRIYKEWQHELAKVTNIQLETVDSHNCVPVWTASSKQEYAARTFRPKMHHHLAAFLTDFPKLTQQGPSILPQTNWQQVRSTIRVDESSTLPPNWCAGSQAALKQLHQFLQDKLGAYSQHRNDPTKNALSNLSPYLHFGHLSAQRVALELQKLPDSDAKTAFFEESVVRRELADNYCYYNQAYDSPLGWPKWAGLTLGKHQDDPKPHGYSLEQLRQAQTHDAAWNAAEIELVTTGKMHGYMRMYWAKKILEWSNSAQEAQIIAIALNDTYSIDGRDPNGYTGIAWAIAGVHDRPWPERWLYGTVRSMSEQGLKRKFAIDEYIRKFLN